MYHRLFTLVMPLMFAIALHAQSSIPFDKAHFPNENALEMALDHLQQGDKLFTGGGSEYHQAFKHYEQAYSLNSNNADLNMKMGLCHLNGRHHTQCLPYFQKVMELEPSTPRIHFLLAFGYQLHAEWDKAIAEYKMHLASISRTPDREMLYNTAERRIEECTNGKALQSRPVRGQVSNMGPSINSEVADYGVLVSADGEQMMFTSRRSNTTGGKINKATNEYFEDIYACQRTAAGWSEPKPLPEPVNSPVNDASVGLFNDGRTMIVYRDEKGSGDLFESKREGDVWSEATSMGDAINSRDNETSAWFSFDRKQLYFVSDREGGQGGQDIWMSRWDGEAEAWGEAENLGPQVNSADDEDGVFVHPDGKTIYYSSKGFNCMGGYDVFTSTHSDGGWSKAMNLGWPVNSPDDDLFFVLTANGSTGFFSSVRPNGIGEDDLYRVDFLPEINGATASTSSTMTGEETASAAGATGDPSANMGTVMLKGRVYNHTMIEGVEARIDLLDLASGTLAATFTTDPKTGQYLAVVPSGRDYALSVHASGCLIHSENISTTEGGGAVELKMNIVMQPLEAGHTEVMQNLFFENDNATLTKSSLAELGLLLDLMRENPKLRLEIGGHTDNEGDDMRNEELSIARAKAVADHLINNGVPAERIEWKGYGSTKPLVPNDTKEHKARNRRTDVQVL